MGRFDRASVSGARGCAGTVCRDLEKSGDDLSGVYWVGVSHEEISTDSAAIIYHCDQRVSVWLSQRKNLPGRIEISLCAGSELLLLSWGCRFMSHWGPASAVEPEGDTGALCRVGILLRIWELSGAFCLRLAVPLRTGTGPSPQNPISQKAPKNSRRLLAEISQIPDFGGVCDPFAALCSEFYRAGPTMVLQIYLSIRHFAWRMAACLCKPLATADDRVAVCMEKSDSGGSAGSVHADLSSVLQVSLPTRCDLRAF